MKLLKSFTGRMAKLVTESPPEIDEKLANSNRARPVKGSCRMPAKCHRTTDFVRRAALYASYDAQLSENTRFFAAASNINAVLAKLFAVVPASHLPRCFGFLTEVGAALEITNRGYARTLARGVFGSGLDPCSSVCRARPTATVRASPAGRTTPPMDRYPQRTQWISKRALCSVHRLSMVAGSCSFWRVLRGRARTSWRGN